MSTSAWDLAGGLVPEILGSPGGVLEVADSWRQAGGRVGGAAGLVGQAAAGTPSWQGEAASAFQESTGGLETDLGSLQTTYQGGAGVLESYAGVLRAAQDAAATLRAQASSLLLDALGDPVKALATMAALTTIAKAAATIQTEVTHAAGTAAAALSTSGISSASSPSPDGGNSSTSYTPPPTTPLRKEEFERIQKELGYAEHERGNTSQGYVGDCSFLATLQAYSLTYDGKRFLIDHMYYHATKKAFIVTLFDKGKPVEVEVRDYYTYGNGHKNADHTAVPDRFSIYERAYGIYFGDSALHAVSAEEAMKHITGQDAEVLRTFNDGFFDFIWGEAGEDHKYNSDQWEQMQKALEEGRPVVGGTAGGDFNGGKWAEVDATTDTDDNGRIDETDKQGKYRIVGEEEGEPGKNTEGHAYTVVSIDDEYVTLKNPWGKNAYTNGSLEEGGLIRIKRSDYEKYFTRTTIGEKPPKHPKYRHWWS